MPLDIFQKTDLYYGYMPEVDTNKEIKQGILALYTRYFGSTTANSYAQFYADKDLKTVLTSAQELITEYAGENKSKQILGEIYKAYNIKPN